MVEERTKRDGIGGRVISRAGFDLRRFLLLHLPIGEKTFLRQALRPSLYDDDQNSPCRAKREQSPSLLSRFQPSPPPDIGRRSPTGLFLRGISRKFASEVNPSHFFHLLTNPSSFEPKRYIDFYPYQPSKAKTDASLSLRVRRAAVLLPFEIYES